MSTVGLSAPRTKDVHFFRTCITVMAVILVSGFITNVAMGRSSFNAPLVVHVHAFVFMAWVGIVVSQVWLAAAGNMQVHRALGGLAIFWAAAMLVMGTLVTAAAVRTGRVPFFLQPQHLLIADPATAIGFAGLFAAAVFLRHRPDWHARLQVGAFAMLMGPGFGRLIPMPLLIPYAFDIAAGLALVFLAVGGVRDWRMHGRPHPAWWVGGATLVGVLAIARVISFSPLGDAIYAMVVQGTPMAGSDGRAFPPLPGLPG